MGIEMTPKIFGRYAYPANVTLLQVTLFALGLSALLLVLVRVFAPSAFGRSPSRAQGLLAVAMHGTTDPKARAPGRSFLARIITMVLVYALSFAAVYGITQGFAALSRAGLTFELDETMVVSVIISGALILLSLVAHFTVLPRLKQRPGKLQLLLELAIEGMEGLAQSQLHGKVGRSMAPYVTTIGLFIFSGGLVELIGLRAPATDLNVTIALALMTFFLINFFSLKTGGIRGRLRHYRPYWLSPILLITDLAAPVSMACRLYGNMLAGLVVMELLYNAIPILIPAVASMYFNLFHAGLQAYIFLTLTLAFIQEGLE